MPVFRNMLARMPDGGDRIMLDFAYDAHRNRKMIYESGRKQVVWPRECSTAKGFRARPR